MDIKVGKLEESEPPTNGDEFVCIRVDSDLRPAGAGAPGIMHPDLPGSAVVLPNWQLQAQSSLRPPGFSLQRLDTIRVETPEYNAQIAAENAFLDALPGLPPR